MPARSTTKTPVSPTSTVPEDLERKVAEAAYYRALQRGFQGGDPVEDWLQAEKEVRGKQQPRAQE